MTLESCQVSPQSRDPVSPNVTTVLNQLSRLFIGKDSEKCQSLWTDQVRRRRGTECDQIDAFSRDLNEQLNGRLSNTFSIKDETEEPL